MKLKKGLFMVVFLLAISSVMAAMSFSSAAVNNDMSVSLVDTQEALLALAPSKVHYAAFTTRENAGKPHNLTIDLDKGFGSNDRNSNKAYGVQPNSVYTWDDLFEVKNNSEYDVNVSIKTNRVSDQGNTVPHSASVDGTNWANLLSSEGLTFTLKAGESKWIDMKTDTTGNYKFLAKGKKGLNLVVEASKK
ncbi:DUF1102 domain-containing protein [Sporosarcina sp. UB5]|uniref:DUF1102 domain-containing protein n=1 Tax=Sporosarcina sp. UB5 TaxID=3047463 RepID=UPI003D798450